MNKTISQMIADGKRMMDISNEEIGAEALTDEKRFDEQEAEKLMEAIDGAGEELIPDSMIRIAYKAQSNDAGTRIWFRSEADQIGPFYADFVGGSVTEFGVAGAKLHAGKVKYDFRPARQNNEPQLWEDAVFLAHQQFNEFERLVAEKNAIDARKTASEEAKKKIAQITSPEALVELYEAAEEAGDFSGQVFAMLAMILNK